MRDKMISNRKEVEIQRQYYARTAAKYNSMHVNIRDEHFLSLALLLATIDFMQVKSILDIGSGTGRAVAYIKKNRPDIRVVGLEPVKELRDIGYVNGLEPADLIDGDATQLTFHAGDYDLVCAFGVLHHVRYPDQVVSEMLRVAAKAIFISDSNNFAQGSYAWRTIKQLFNLIGLWNIANFLKTKGRGYRLSEGDGISYSYSIFNNYKQIEVQCSTIHLLNTQGGRINFYKTAGHLALLGVKR